MSAITINIDSMDNQTKIDLIGDIWASIDEKNIPLKSWHKKALDESLDKYGNDPSKGTPWDDFKKELLNS